MKYTDLADNPEDARIKTIGEAAMISKKPVAFLTDAEPGKRQRYIDKLLKRFPDLEIVGLFDGPIANVCGAKVFRKQKK